MLGNDIGAFENGTVVATEVGFLQLYLIAVLLELLLYPLATALMSLAIHGAWAKVALLLTEEIGRVGTELDLHHSLLVARGFLSSVAG